MLSFDNTKVLLEDFFLRDLLPAADVPIDNDFDNDIYCTNLDFLGMEVVENEILQVEDVLGIIATAPVVLDGRGRGPRKKPRTRDPYQSLFYLKYIQEAEEAMALDDQDGTIWDTTSSDGKTFRRRFGLPYSTFHMVYLDWRRHGEYRAQQDRAGRNRVDSRILLLGCFRALAKGTTFDGIEELTDVSVSHIHSFFVKFIAWFYSHYHTTWIVFPATTEQVVHVESRYAGLGLPGCLGSVDCVHVGWDMCPGGFNSDCIGKEGYPTLAFQVIVSHSRRILAVTQSFFGTWNDKTIVKFDDKVKQLRVLPFYTNYYWQLLQSNGDLMVQKGLYLICDGGYHQWQTLIPPYKHQIEGTAQYGWSKHVESLRKDVECTFGILKKRFSILKLRARLHSKELIEDIFRCCCILHNMNHDFDGYDARDMNNANPRNQAQARDQETLEADFVHALHELQERERFILRRELLIDHFQYCRSQGVDFNSAGH